MMNGLRIKEAIAFAVANGRDITKKDVAAKLWPESREETQVANINNLMRGDVVRVTPQMIRGICEICGCSADFLIGNETIL